MPVRNSVTGNASSYIVYACFCCSLEQINDNNIIINVIIILNSVGTAVVKMECESKHFFLHAL